MSSLCNWYGNREILLTGVTSELGKNYSQKLLRECPNVTLYALIRPEEELGINERLEEILRSPGYKRISEEAPNFARRIKAIQGDLNFTDISISANDVESLRNVSVLIHMGGPYRLLLDFSQKNFPNLQTIVIVESINMYYNNDLIPESWISREYKFPAHLSVAVVRFPALGSAHRDPMPGYVEKLRGPTALIIGAGLALGNPDFPAEFIPIDIATNTVIAATRDATVRKKPDPVVVYNGLGVRCTWRDLVQKSHAARKKFPYPSFGFAGITPSPAAQWFIVLLLEWLPCAACDLFLFLLCKKQRFLEEHVRVRRILKSLEPIALKAWVIERTNVNDMENSLDSEDRELFPIRVNIDFEAYAVCTAFAARKFCMDYDNLRISRMFFPVLYTIIFFLLGYYYYCVK